MRIHLMGTFSKTDIGKYIVCLLGFTTFFAFNAFGKETVAENELLELMFIKNLDADGPVLRQSELQDSTEVSENKEDLEKQNDEGSSELKKEESDQGVVSKVIEKISNTKISDLKKPFSDQPGYVEKIPEFDKTLYNLDTRKEFRIRDLRGNVVVVFFTTTWCPNCPSVLKDLDGIADKLAKTDISNVTIVPLVIGDDTENYIRNHYKVNDIQSLDVFKPISPFDPGEGIRGVPFVIVYNKKGESVWAFSGVGNYASQEFLDFIETLAKEE